MNARTATSTQNEADGKALRFLGIGGYSCFTGWFLLAAFDLLPHYPGAFSGWINLLPCIMFFGGMAVFTIALRMFADKFEHVNPSKPVAIGFTLIGSLTSMYAAAGWSNMLQSFVILNILALLAGCTAVYFFFVWDDFGGRSKTGAYVRYLATAICAGDTLFLFSVLSLDNAARCLFSLGLIALSGIILCTVNELSVPIRQSQEEALLSKSDDAKKVPLDKRIRVLFFIFGIAFGLAWMLILASYPEKVFTAFIISIAAGAALLFLIRQDAVIHDHYVTTLIRVCVAVLGVSFLLLAFSDGTPALIFLSIICASWQLFSIVDASLLMRHASKYGFSIPRHTAVGRMGNYVGFVLGTILGVLTPAMLGQSAIVILCVIMTATMVVSGMLLFPFENRTSPDASNQIETIVEAPAAPLPQSLQESCRSVAALYGLSQREEEILQFLVKGRNNRVIAESLFISENTAKTHVYNIYKKMGVHSRQEALDIVEMIERP